MKSCLIYLLVLKIQWNTGFLFDGMFFPQGPAVQTKVGEIHGKLKTIKFDGHVYQVQEFLGIPYAEPPIGDNRLRKPVPKAPFMSPYAATTYGSSCLQPFPLGNETLSEDCLFLNIFVPGNSIPSQNSLPVMVFIHGGGFVSGSSTIYAGDNLSAFGSVIVVTLNYRLAHLGFLLTEEGASNFGLWDQHLAIKWVHDNIKAFGGDVLRVTIFGESAGSTSVLYQSLFSRNKNLFQRVIAQSGGITSSWSFTPYQSAKANFANFTGESGCYTGNHSSTMACLRNKTSEEIATIIKSPTLNYTLVLPNMDNDFVLQHPRLMLSSKTGGKESLDFFYSLDFMMGSTSGDGALYLSDFSHDPENLTISRHLYEDFYVPTTVSAIFSDVLNIPKVMKDAAVFVYTNWSCPNDDMARNLMLVKLLTDSSLFAPSVATVGLHSEGFNGRTYLYLFSVRPGTHLLPLPSWLDGPTKANHADDLTFVFGFSDEMIQFFRDSGLKYDYTLQDVEIAKGVMTMWTNFANSGNPNEPVSISPYLPTTWSEYYTSSQRYLDITPVMTSDSVKQRLAAKGVEFWLKLLPSLLNSST